MKWKALQAGKTKCIAVHTALCHFFKHVAVLKWNKRFCRLPVGFWLLLTGASKCSDKTMSLSKSNISAKAAVSKPCNIFQINTVSCIIGKWQNCILLSSDDVSAYMIQFLSEHLICLAFEIEINARRGILPNPLIKFPLLSALIYKSNCIGQSNGWFKRWKIVIKKKQSFITKSVFSRNVNNWIIVETPTISSKPNPPLGIFC